MAEETRIPTDIIDVGAFKENNVGIRTGMDREFAEIGLVGSYLDPTLLGPGPSADSKFSAQEAPAEVTLATVTDARSAQWKNRRRMEKNGVPPLMRRPPPAIQVPDDEVILSVTVYHNARVSKNQDFLLCGTQKLSELRDVIYCVKDQLYADEDSGGVGVALTQSSNHSAFFFIEGTFYNVTRHPHAIDYSAPIREWLEQEGRLETFGLGAPQVKDMSSVQFDQLSIRLNMPYVYYHQGDCEHVIMFTDIRLLQRSDIQDMRMYPHETFRFKERRKKCMICEIFHAEWITYDDELACENPCLFCESCYTALHFDANGTQKCEFKKMRYYHE